MMIVTGKPCVSPSGETGGWERASVCCVLLQAWRAVQTEGLPLQSSGSIQRGRCYGHQVKSKRRQQRKGRKRGQQELKSERFMEDTKKGREQ